MAKSEETVTFVLDPQGHYLDKPELDEDGRPVKGTRVTVPLAQAIALGYPKPAKKAPAKSTSKS